MMNAKPLCSAISSSGERCRHKALDGSDYCYSHSPERAAERKANAAEGGRARSRRRPSEIELIKKRIDEATRAVLEGRISREAAAVAFQGFNALLRCIETERRIAEQEELAERLDELERRAQHSPQWGGRRYN